MPPVAAVTSGQSIVRLSPVAVNGDTSRCVCDASKLETRKRDGASTRGRNMEGPASATQQYLIRPVKLSATQSSSTGIDIDVSRLGSVRCFSIRTPRTQRCRDRCSTGRLRRPSGCLFCSRRRSYRVPLGRILSSSLSLWDHHQWGGFLNAVAHSRNCLLSLDLHPHASLKPVSELLDVDFGDPLHYLVICGRTNSDEDKLLERYRYRTAKNPSEQSPADQNGSETAASEKNGQPETRGPRLLNCPGAHGLIVFATPTTPDFNCDVCRGKIPTETRARGCRQCDYVVCISCGALPDGGVGVVIKKTNCPGAHGLTAFRMPYACNCDLCHEWIREGSDAYGCRRCDFDVCTDCGTADDGSFVGVEASKADAALHHAGVAEASRWYRRQVQIGRAHV